MRCPFVDWRVTQGDMEPHRAVLSTLGEVLRDGGAHFDWERLTLEFFNTPGVLSAGVQISLAQRDLLGRDYEEYEEMQYNSDSS